jgi:hypothetical protein
MTAVYCVLDEQTLLPVAILNSHPVLGWNEWSAAHTAQSQQELSSYIGYFGDFNFTQHARTWLGLLLFFLMREHVPEDYGKLMTVSRCFATVKSFFPESLRSVPSELHLSITVRINADTIHYFNVKMQRPEFNYFAKCYPEGSGISWEQIAKLHHWLWSLWDLMPEEVFRFKSDNPLQIVERQVGNIRQRIYQHEYGSWTINNLPAI